MYQRILIPIDGSETSERALREALKLATGNTHLRLVHVLEIPYPLDSESLAFFDYPGLQNAVKQTGERILAQAVERLKKFGLTAETALLDANGEHIATTIAAEAENWQADLIIIGTHGRSGWSRLLLGSVAEGVERLARAPVLLVRAE
ncbi:MAG: universal stress protein [Gallionellaceae bacterium]|jgi:nucleotide-binding universal stress UspA family protein